jgi:hypothetical protein
MRYPDTGPPVDCNGKNLTSGHSIVFSKNGNQITAIDPQQMSVRENINASSSFKAWQKNCYISISLIYGFSGNIQAMQYPEQEDVDMTDAYELEYNSPQMAARAASPQMIVRESSPRIAARPASPRIAARPASPQMIVRESSPRIAARPASSRPSQFEMPRLPTMSRRLYQPLYQPVSPIPKSNKSSSLPYKPLLRRGYNQPLYNQLDIGIEPLGYISQIPLSDKVSSSRPYQTEIKERPDRNSRSESPASKRSLARLELLTREEDQEEKTRNKRCIGSNCVLMFGAKSHKALKSARKSRKAHKSTRKSRKALKSARKSRKALKSDRKSRKARKSDRKSRKARKSTRKSRKSRKSTRKSRKALKSLRKSRKALKSTRNSRKALKSTRNSRKTRKSRK